MSLIAHLSGTIHERGPNWLILDVNGIGFLVHVTASVLAEAGPVGEPMFLYTHLHVGPEGPTVYGFTSTEELHLFQMLIGVAGVGPKGALSLLSVLPANALAAAIAGDDVEVLTRAPGIGRRTAARLVLELNEKLKGYSLRPIATSADDDVIAALTALGYSRAEAETAIRALPPQDSADSVEERVRQALRYLAEGVT